MRRVSLVKQRRHSHTSSLRTGTQFLQLLCAPLSGLHIELIERYGVEIYQTNGRSRYRTFRR